MNLTRITSILVILAVSAAAVSMVQGLRTDAKSLVHGPACTPTTVGDVESRLHDAPTRLLYVVESGGAATGPHRITSSVYSLPPSSCGVSFKANGYSFKAENLRLSAFRMTDGHVHFTTADYLVTNKPLTGASAPDKAPARLG